MRKGILFKRIKKVAVSGGFDPLHVGHLRMMKKAAKYGDLYVILNNDNWLKAKKGYAFIPEAERKELIEGYDFVKKVIVTDHVIDDPNRSVCHELNDLEPDIFCNGGDRVAGNIPEYELCETIGIKMLFNVGGGKVQSSSEMVKRAKEHDR